jgi:hypothetical protein
VSVDLETRTGTFRAEKEDKIYPFAVMPYAEMLHHATRGDLSDFKIGERAIFRLHVNDKEEWYWLTYIQDEMNMLNGHKEFYCVDSLDSDSGRIGFTWAKADLSFIREQGLFLQTKTETRYWKAGKPAQFSDIKLGDRLRAKTHGIGKGEVRVCWEVFLDQESLDQFQAEQIAVHNQRIEQEGAPGYVNVVEGSTLELSLFDEGQSLFKQFKTAGQIQIAPAGEHRKPTREPLAGTIVAINQKGRSCTITLKLDMPATDFHVTKLARLWLAKPEAQQP